MALAFLLGLKIVLKKDFKGIIQPQQIIDLVVFLLLGSLMGARLLYVINEWPQFSKHWIEIVMIQKGGLVFYGGFMGGLLVSTVYLKVKKIPFWPVADGLVVAIALGQSIGRIGCYFNGCCYGMPVKWGICFPQNSLASYQYGWPHRLFPTQAISSLLLLILFIFLSWSFNRKRFNGEVFSLYLIGYSSVRFLSEFWRGDVVRFFWQFTEAQWISVLLFALGWISYISLYHKKYLSNFMDEKKSP